MGLVHLHRHSDFSLLDGVGTAEQYAKRAVELGQDSLAITDHGTLGGVLYHIRACEAHSIKPIIGMEAYWRFDRHQRKKNVETNHLTLLASGPTGWANLMRIATEAHKSFYGKPPVDWDLLSRYRDGIWVGSACIQSPLATYILAGRMDVAEKWIKKMQRIVGDRLYVEIMPVPGHEQSLYNSELLKLAHKFSIPVVATADVHYPYEGWEGTQDVLVMCNTHQSLRKRKEARAKGKDVFSMKDIPTLFLMDEGEMKKLFLSNHGLASGVVDEAIQNTRWVADQIDDIQIDRKLKLPKVPDSERQVRSWVNTGLRLYRRDRDQEYLLRVEMEMKVFKDQGVVDYFAILGDMVRWAKEQGIRVGVGRGSAGGSLVAYLIGITAVDPIAYGLIFERFMNPGRKVMPDIDVDFQHDRRHEVVEYVSNKWHCANVGAYQRFGPKAAIREVARVLDIPYEESTRVTKGLDDEKGSLTLTDIRKVDESLDKFATKHPHVWESATRLEGQHARLSKHPAGIVVLDRPVEEMMPLIRGNDGGLQTAWAESKQYAVISDFGYLKIDALGTDALTQQAFTLDLIEKRRGYRPNLDNLPVLRDPSQVDPWVMDAFCRGRTVGVFQFNSAPLTDLLKRMKPRRIADLLAAVAIIRPGPLQAKVDVSYIARGKGEEEVEFFHPLVEKALLDTYGLMIYQEQTMEVVRQIGGFSMAEADDVRRAVGKKDLSKMSGYHEQFVDGAQKRNMTKQEGEDLWDKLVYFSGYGFNLAHSAGYALQAYQDMWLKVFYPVEFYTSVATFEPDKISRVFREAKAQGVEILPPDVNKSDIEFSIESDNAIRYGLAAVKHVGAAASKAIVRRRPFKDYGDFDARITPREAPSNVREVLALVGAFDSIGGHPLYSHQEASEKEFLGVRISGKQDGELHELLDRKLYTETELDNAMDGEAVAVGGEIVKIKEHTTRKGARMAFIDFEHGPDSYSCVLFPGVWAKCQAEAQPGVLALVYGKWQEDRRSVVAFDFSTASALYEQEQRQRDDLVQLVAAV